MIPWGREITNGHKSQKTYDEIEMDHNLSFWRTDCLKVHQWLQDGSGMKGEVIV